MRDKVPSIGEPAPIFKGTAIVNGEVKTLSLEQYHGQYVVFFFYPLNYSAVCPTEIIAFSERFQEFKKINTAVVACSTDNHYSHLSWINTSKQEGGLGPINIPLLADKSHEISKMYGVLDDVEGISFRALFIIDDKGILRQITINDMEVGRSVDEVLRLVQAFQFADAHAEYCPVNWTPGMEGLKPNKVKK